MSASAARVDADVGGFRRGGPIGLTPDRWPSPLRQRKTGSDQGRRIDPEAGQSPKEKIGHMAREFHVPVKRMDESSAGAEMPKRFSPSSFSVSEPGQDEVEPFEETGQSPSVRQRPLEALGERKPLDRVCMVHERRCLSEREPRRGSR